MTTEEKEYIENNYELCYLFAAHECIKQTKVDTIITGLSYGIDDFETSYMKHSAINLSMHSQDLYYDYLNICKALEENSGIKNVVMTFGYYSLFYDLSQSSSKAKCISTYLPLFSDIHNCNLQIPEEPDRRADLYRFRQCILDYFGERPEYYGSTIEREITNYEVYNMGGWYRLQKETRIEKAKQLAAKHNNHIKHLKTYGENTQLLVELFDILENKNISIYVLIPPFSPEYNDAIYHEYEKYLLDFLNIVPSRIEYINMNEMGFESTKYFIDADHLNLRGAIEATGILDGLLN